MAIQVQWDNHQQTAIHVEFESEWTWDQLETTLDHIDRLMSSVHHPVDVIIDLEGSKIPGDFLTAAKNLLADPQPNPNEGARIVVGANKTMRAVYTTVQKTFGERIAGRELLFAPNLEDARAILRGLRMD